MKGQVNGKVAGRLLAESWSLTLNYCSEMVSVLL